MTSLPILPHQSPDALTVMEGALADAPLTQEMYEEMKRRTDNWRDTLILMLLRNTGFRPYEVVRLQRRHVDRMGMAYFVSVERAKKRGKTEAEPIFISPNLGQPLLQWLEFEKRKPMESIFGIKERRLRDVVYAASMEAFGFKIEPKRFRRMYVRTVAEIAAQVLGFQPRHMEVAQKMVGHESVRTSWDWYFELTLEERRAIQERIPV